MYSAYPGISLRGSGGVQQSALYGFDPYKINGSPAITGTYNEQVTCDNSSTFIGVGPSLEGKTYIEFELTSKSDNNIYQAIGVFDAGGNGTIWYSQGSWSEYGRGPQTFDGCGVNLASGLISDGSPSLGAGNIALNWSPGDRMGMAFDATTGNVWFRKGGAWQQGDPNTLSSPALTVTNVNQGKFYWVSNYGCSATPPYNTVWKVFPTASTQLYAAPSGFLPFQSATVDTFSCWNFNDRNKRVFSTKVFRQANLYPTLNGWSGGIRGYTGRPATGNWYFEILVVTDLSNATVGVATGTATFLNNFCGSTIDSWGFGGGFKYNNGSNLGAYGASVADGDVVGVQLNAGALTFYKNGVSMGSPAFTGLTGTLYPGWGVGIGAVNQLYGCKLNTGKEAFVGGLPSGASAWG